MTEVAAYEISVDGTDVSSNFAPLLLSLTIQQTDRNSADTCAIELDDTGGQIELPMPGALVQVALGWQDDGSGDWAGGGSVVTFEGYIDEPKSGGKTGKHADFRKPHHLGGGSEQGLHSDGGRSRGTILTITAKSADTTSKVKQPMQAHADNMSFKDVAQQWATAAGLGGVAIDETLGGIQRAYWAIANESFLAWGARMARELGATFKVFQGTAVFVSRTGSQSASGQALAEIDVVWGVNLIEWSISPVLSRPDFGTLAVRWYDPVQAQWQVETQQNSGTSSDVTHTERFKAPAQDHAQQKAASNSAESQRDKGGGDMVTIDGNPDAQCQALCNVSGIRDGVDGTYLIAGVTHRLTRGGGFTTQLTLKNPTNGAGTDSRSSQSAGSGGDGASG